MRVRQAERNHADDNVKAMIRDMLRSSLAEIEKALDQMVAQSDALVPAITAGLDTNGDGKVSNDEVLLLEAGSGWRVMAWWLMQRRYEQVLDQTVEQIDTLGAVYHCLSGWQDP